MLTERLVLFNESLPMLHLLLLLIYHLLDFVFQHPVVDCLTCLRPMLICFQFVDFSLQVAADVQQLVTFLHQVGHCI